MEASNQAGESTTGNERGQLTANGWVSCEVVGCIVSITPLWSTVQPANFPDLSPIRRYRRNCSAFRYCTYFPHLVL